MGTQEELEILYPVTGQYYTLSLDFACNVENSNWLLHIRRFQEYFNHIHIFIGSTTSQFLQFSYQNGVNILFLVVKPIEVTPVFILKLMKKLLDGATLEIFDI
jgi:hypothetical protein